jgi:hypothetical protein
MIPLLVVKPLGLEMGVLEEKPQDLKEWPTRVDIAMSSRVQFVHHNPNEKMTEDDWPIFP